MKKNQKILSLILCLILTLGLCIIPSNPASAISTTDGLYLYSESVPFEANEYCKENAYKFLLSYKQEYGIDIGIYNYGQPFVLTNHDTDVVQYYFPIINTNTNKIDFTFRVVKYEDGFSGALSEALAPELNALALKTSDSAPATIEINNGNIIAIVNNNIDILIEDPLGNAISNVYTKNSSNNSIVNCLDTSNNQIDVIAEPKSGYKYLNTVIYEDQGSNSWCAAYVSAFIINFAKGTNLRAIDIIKTYYPSGSTSSALSRTQTVNYAKKYNMYLWPLTRKLSISEAEAQINNNSPFYTSNLVSTGGSHAIAVRGYNPYSYSIWNPWDTYYTSVDKNLGIYTHANGRTFTWTETLADWR